jgi:hypothetical protein
MQMSKKGIIFFMGMIVLISMMSIVYVYINFSAKLYRENNYLGSELIQGSYDGIIEINKALLYTDYSGRHALRLSLDDFQDFIECKSPTGLILINESCELNFEDAIIKSFDLKFIEFLEDNPYDDTSVRNFKYSFADGKFQALGYEFYKYQVGDFNVMNSPYFEMDFTYNFEIINDKYAKLVKVKVDCEGDKDCIFSNLPEGFTIDNPNIVYSTKILDKNVDFLFNI